MVKESDSRIPEQEWRWLVEFIREKSWLIDPVQVVDAYRRLGIVLVPDPFSGEVAERIVVALRAGGPFSAIRLGDGEANWFTFNEYPEIPVASALFARKIIAMQSDKCPDDEATLAILKQEMWQSIERADIIGLPGLWRPRAYSCEEVVSMFERDPRGISGQVLGIDYLYSCAAAAQLPEEAMLASAHFYFGLIIRMPELLASARKCICLSNRPEAVEELKRAAPNKSCHHVWVGQRDALKISEPLGFIEETLRELPSNLESTLCLVGAGPWSELYCMRIRARGGVAVDLGSGFDLLAGLETRPVHREIRSRPGATQRK